MLNEVRNLEQVTSLTIDRTNQLLNECRCIVFLAFFVSKRSPCWVYCQFLILASALNCSEVEVNNVLTLLRVRLHDERLHLLYSQVQRNNLSDTEESRLENGVGTVSKTNFLSYLSGIDIVNLDIVLGKATLNLVRNEVNQLLAVEDSVEQECTILAQTAGNVIHVEVSLNVTSYKVRSIYLISAVDGAVAETQVRAGKTTRLLRVIREVSLAILVGIVTDNLYRVLVSTYSTIGTETIELSLKQVITTHWDFLLFGKRCKCNVINDTYGEVILGLWQFQVLEYCYNLSRCSIG